MANPLAMLLSVCITIARRDFESSAGTAVRATGARHEVFWRLKLAMTQSRHRTSGYLVMVDVQPCYCLHILMTVLLQARHCLFVSHIVTAYIAANVHI